MPNKIEIKEDLIIKVKELFEQDMGSRKIAKILSVSRHIVQQVYKLLDLYDTGRTLPRHVYKMTEKSCTNCKKIKPVDQFRKRISKYTDGIERISYESLCLECQSVYDNERLKKRAKELRKTDPNFRIRRSVSHLIWRTLNCNNSSKDGESCLQYLGYSIEELKQHLESQFEPWMAWNNHGKYVISQWDDNKKETWTWNIDHIIPQSDLPYTSMSDENFKKCWKLSNLRPLSAKQNIIDGTSGIRHDNAA